jgi:hypothetical protein
MGYEDPEIEALPPPRDTHSKHGVYYHINFHDLQASNQVTMLVNPELIREQFDLCHKRGIHEYMILNVGNIRPHIFDIEFVCQYSFAPFGLAEKPEQRASCHYQKFMSRHFPENSDGTAEIYRQYFLTPFLYGKHKDDRAGDELYHYALRAIILKAIRNDFSWEYQMAYILPDAGFEEKTKWFIDRAEKSQETWDRLLEKATQVAETLSGPSQQYFKDNIGMQIKFNCRSNCALALTGRAVLAFLKKDETALRTCFLLTSKAKWQLEKVLACLKMTEHGKWENFYRGECLTGVRMSIRLVTALQAISRLLGESPYRGWAEKMFFSKAKTYLDIRQQKKINNNDELARKMLANSEEYLAL